MMQIFKPLSNMLDLKFFENSARNKSPTYLCKHMTFFLVWAFGQCNSTELSHGPSFIYNWSIAHILEQEFFCLGCLGSSGQ